MLDKRDALMKAVDAGHHKHITFDAVAAERERCAKIAEAHKGTAAAKRRKSGYRLSELEDYQQQEIIAEERGEDIAAEMIARAIRNQKD